MEGKKFASDFTQVETVESSDKLMIEKNSSGVVGYATVAQLSDVMGGGKVEPDFFQAPKLIVERVYPTNDYENGKNPTITITHPYYEEHPDKCFFVLMKRTRAMRRRISSSGGPSYTSKKKWNFYKGALCNLESTPYYGERSLPVQVPDTIRADELLRMFLERGVLQLETDILADSLHHIYILSQENGDDTPVFDSLVGENTLDGYQLENIYFGNRTFRMRKSLSVGIALVMENPDFQGINNWQNWDGSGLYRWLVSEVAPFKIVANDIRQSIFAALSI